MGFKKKKRKWNRSSSERTGENRKLATEMPLGTDYAKKGRIRYVHMDMYARMYVPTCISVLMCVYV